MPNQLRSSRGCVHKSTAIWPIDSLENRKSHLTVCINSSWKVKGGRLKWSFILCQAVHMLKSGHPSTQYSHPLSSCFSRVPPTEYIYMFRICQPMVDDSKFSRMLTAGTCRWSHTSFLHYTTHTHTHSHSIPAQRPPFTVPSCSLRFEPRGH